MFEEDCSVCGTFRCLDREFSVKCLHMHIRTYTHWFYTDLILHACLSICNTHRVTV